MIEIYSSPIQAINWSFAEHLQVSIDIKRDDLLHPVISGNKWRKLKYLLEDAKHKQCEPIITMGGNWSNHLHALAFAGQSLGVKTQAFVRAHPDQALTPTLIDCQNWGMALNYVSRKEYAQLRQHKAWDSLQQDYPKSYWIGEGGFSQLAMRGVQEVGEEVGLEVDEEYDYIFVGCGSGATLCGLVAAFPNSHIVGIAAFSGAEYLEEELRSFLCKEYSEKEPQNWTLDTEHHCGGFAKSSQELSCLITSLELENDFELDAVYNGKVFLALQSWLQQGKLARGSKVLAIHTGGLQGKR